MMQSVCGLSLVAVYKESFISEVVCVCVCVCVIVHTCQCNMTPRKRNTIGFKTEEQLAEAVNEILNDSDSDGDNIPEFSSSEESGSESANASDNESNISKPGTNHRQTDVSPNYRVF